MATTKINVIIIDDSKLDCFVAEKIIKNTGMCESVISYQTARDALRCITERGVYEGLLTVLMVDIRMQVMNGFEFAAAFSVLPENVTDQYRLWLINSSKDEEDLKKISDFPIVKQFLSKPISSNSLAGLLQQEMQRAES